MPSRISILCLLQQCQSVLPRAGGGICGDGELGHSFNLLCLIKKFILTGLLQEEPHYRTKRNCGFQKESVATSCFTNKTFKTTSQARPDKKARLHVFLSHNHHNFLLVKDFSFYDSV